MKCPNCDNINHSELAMLTKTTWGHGDCQYETIFKCLRCGHSSDPIGGYGLFPENQEWREPQKEFAVEKTLEKKYVLVCEKCGGFDVDVQAWVNVNTNEYSDDTDDSRPYCNTCGHNVNAIEREDAERKENTSS